LSAGRDRARPPGSPAGADVPARGGAADRAARHQHLGVSPYSANGARAAHSIGRPPQPSRRGPRWIFLVELVPKEVRARLRAPLWKG
jgi:hypothetical protein